MKINAVKAYANRVWRDRAKDEGFESEEAMWRAWVSRSRSGLAILFNCTEKTICNRMKKHGIEG